MNVYIHSYHKYFPIFASVLYRTYNLSSSAADFKIYDVAAQRRGLQNKIIIRARQSEWIICSPKSILNTVLVL